MSLGLYFALLDNGDTSPGWTPHDVFPYATTTIVFLIIFLQAMALLLATRFWHHGVRLLVTKGVLVSPEDEPSFGNESMALQQYERRCQRKITRTTNNIHWCYFFALQSVYFFIAIADILASRYVGVEVERIMTMFLRLGHGLSSVSLAVALNYQRLYRVKENRRAKLSRQLMGQALWMNRICLGMFLFLLAADFAAVHIISGESSKAAKAMYWLAIFAECTIALPSVIATVWVVFHRAPIEPDRLSKATIFFAVFLRCLVMFPPSLWNDHLLRNVVLETPCPGHSFFSLYDVFEVLHGVALLLIFVFVRREFKRNEIVVVGEHAARCDAAVQRTEAASERSIEDEDGPPREFRPL
jgi:hypothetical protein